jgi:hypothetical protein
MADLWVVGDIHGAYDKVRAILLRAGLIDFDGAWTAGDAHLVFLGDYMDRGPDGLGVVRFVRNLEVQARLAGGEVTALLGNHEVMFLAAQRFRRTDPDDQYGFHDYWISNGGQPRDAARMEAGDHAWLSERPALARAGNWLLMHADTRMYTRFGGSIEDINAAIRALLQTNEPEAWGSFANAFADRFAFSLSGGEKAASQILRVLGGERLVHGHTPVYILLDENMHGPTLGPGAPIPYAGRLCVAMDSGMAYRDDAGFIARLDATGIAEVVTFPSGAPLH